MKTLQELYDKVISDEELKKEFVNTKGDDEAIQAFLKKFGVEAKTEDVLAFIREKHSDDDVEMTVNEIAAVAGGKAWWEHVIASTAGMVVGCVGDGLVSEFSDKPTECY